jgi:NAD(P)-dependent dehydrogenase (short-subunit alcohol dehydrogenase family)
VKLADNHAVVTGGANGIGRALAQRFAEEGARVVVADLDLERASETAAEIGGLAVAVDVSDEASLRALVERAESEVGPIDLFCSNAGIGVFGGVEVANEDWQKIWGVNVMAHVYAARAVLPSICSPRSIPRAIRRPNTRPSVSQNGSPSPTAIAASRCRYCARKRCAPRCWPTSKTAASRAWTE